MTDCTCTLPHHLSPAIYGRWGVFTAAAGGWSAEQASKDNLDRLVMAVEAISLKAALKAGRMPRTEQDCRMLVEGIVNKLNSGVTNVSGGTA